MMKDNRIRKVFSMLLAVCMLTGTWTQAGFTVLAEVTDMEEAFLEAETAEDLLTEDTDIVADEQDDAYEVASDLSAAGRDIFVDDAALDDVAEEYVIEDEFIDAYDTAEDFVETVDGLDVSMIYAEADIDTISPVIDLSSLSVSISSGEEAATVGDIVTISVNMTDDRGIDFVPATFQSPVSGNKTNVIFSYAGTDEDSKNGLWTYSFNVTDETENGTWKLYHLGAVDTGGNSCGLGIDDLSAADFEVYGTNSDPDMTLPEIDLDSLSVSISSGEEAATVGDIITISVNITDDRSINFIPATFQSPVSGTRTNVNFSYAGTDGESKNGLWTYSFSVTDETENGTWKLCHLGAVDTSGNSCGLGIDDLSAADFEVYGTNSDPDMTLPEIDLDSLSVSISSGEKAAIAGEIVTISVNMTDDRGIDFIPATFQSPVSGTRTNVNFSYAGTNGESKNGLWTFSFNVTDETENGTWKLYYLGAVDTSGNSCSLWIDDLSAADFEVLSPECPYDLTTEGYSMMLNGIGATTTFGGSYYVNTADETVTPDVKVRFDAEDGSWTTLAPRKYTLKYEKKIGDDSWEEYTDSTFGVDENGTADYRVSATGKESLYYTGTVGPVRFNVTRKAKVTFNTNGGSTIDQQYIIPGEKAAEPAAPTREGRFFNMWYSDEGLTNIYWFTEPVTEDITLYAGWILQAGIGIYNQSNPNNNRCGTIDITSDSWEYNYHDVTTMNYTLAEESVTFTAKPAEGYTFKGWYEGVFGDSHYIETPSEALISDQNPYTPTSADEAKALCAVFECTQHQWEQKIQKATPDTDGRIYQVCSICGTEETVAPLLRVSNITFEGTSYTYTGKPIEPKVTVANTSENLSADNYTVAYSNNTGAGTATIKVILKGDYYEGVKELTFRISPLSVGSASVTGLTAKTYTGKPITQSPVVKVGNTVLRAGTDYTVLYRNNTNAGTATVVVTGKGNYLGTIEKTFTIAKAANPFKFSAKTASVKYSKLKKKAQTLTVSKVIKFTGKGQGTMKYTLSSAKKGKRSFKKYFKINAKTGKVTVKKGLKKGTYKVKVKVTAAGNANYLPSAVKTVTFKVKVK